MQKVAEEKKNTGGKSTKKIKSIGVQKKFQGFSKGMQKKRGENTCCQMSKRGSLN